MQALSRAKRIDIRVHFIPEEKIREDPTTTTFIATSAASSAMASAKPNILVIMSDDVGITNISAYSRGLAGYQTPNIDRIANGGVTFTDYSAEQSCTAGRSAFITGQHPVRTGLTKVGFPGAEIGIQAEDPTLAELLKNHGYATGQFGKNHLGDRNNYLPTQHRFDEFYGNLYHLNAETDSNNYRRWWIERVFTLVPSQVITKEFIDTFKEFPPHQKPAKFNVDDALAAMKAGGCGG